MDFNEAFPLAERHAENVVNMRRINCNKLGGNEKIKKVTGKLLRKIPANWISDNF
jgi:hypothetical protein